MQYIDKCYLSAAELKTSSRELIRGWLRGRFHLQALLVSKATVSL